MSKALAVDPDITLTELKNEIHACGVPRSQLNKASNAKLVQVASAHGIEVTFSEALPKRDAVVEAPAKRSRSSKRTDDAETLKQSHGMDPNKCKNH